MATDPIVTALHACGLQCMEARDGRGRRWAVHRCITALQEHGTPPALAERCARAMETVAMQAMRHAWHQQPPTQPQPQPAA